MMYFYLFNIIIWSAAAILPTYFLFLRYTFGAGVSAINPIPFWILAVICYLMAVVSAILFGRALERRKFANFVQAEATSTGSSSPVSTWQLVQGLSAVLGIISFAFQFRTVIGM